MILIVKQNLVKMKTKEFGFFYSFLRAEVLETEGAAELREQRSKIKYGNSSFNKLQKNF